MLFRLESDEHLNHYFDIFFNRKERRAGAENAKG
jgi:hypothetical protein